MSNYLSVAGNGRSSSRLSASRTGRIASPVSGRLRHASWSAVVAKARGHSVDRDMDAEADTLVVTLFAVSPQQFDLHMVERLSHQQCPTSPAPAEVSQFFVDLLGAMFSDFTQLAHLSEKELEELFHRLQKELERILRHNPAPGGSNPVFVADKFFQSLPDIFNSLQQDVTAMFEGDPAAKSRNEVIGTYPGFYAIAAYRLAHTLHQLGIKGIPRIITEHAHSKTGIDIHPAARIGTHFCIDHGTGIVIGETTVIGNHVKIYQGVTLGALSLNKEDAEKKRHPTIGNHVVIYSGATILGGETEIGHDSIIGGNVWITKRLAPHSKVYYQAEAGNRETLLIKI